ncbi:polyhydroxyalkanoic acid system family protein [Myxococcota bacterium]|nr:polyhydroxyalkanoic acid system family protein [Myxococcota bacterium]
MSQLSIKRSHSLSVDEAKERVSKFETKLQQSYGVSLDWKDSTSAMLRGKGFSGKLSLDASSVDVDIKLGLMLRPLKSKIQSAIEDALDKELA